MSSITFNKTYNFEIKDISFGSLDKETVASLFKDGRVCSHFIERELENWFEDLTFVNGKGYDHVDSNGVKYDQKCFTKGGLKFAPSVMIGGGRSIDAPVAEAHVKETKYICCDITDFPKVRVIFKHGEDLIRDYPGFGVKGKEKEVLFE